MKFRKGMSTLLALALLMGIMPTAGFAIPTEGDSLTYRGVTGAVTSVGDRNLEITVTPEEERHSTRHSFYLYSPSQRQALLSGNGEVATVRYSTGYYNLYNSNVLNLWFSSEGEMPSDYRLQDLYSPNRPPWVAGVHYNFKTEYASQADLGEAAGAVLSGTLGFTATGSSNEAGLHMFVPGGSVLESAEPAYLALETDGSYDSVEKTGEFTLHLADPLPETSDFYLYHVFWGDDGTLTVAGGDETQNLFCAAYSDEGQMLWVHELEKQVGQIYEGYTYYPSDTYFTAKLEDAPRGATLKIFTVDDNFVPVSGAITKPLEIVSIQVTTLGDETKKGSVTLSVEGTGSTGDATLTETETDPVEDTRLIAAVDAKMDGGTLSSDGVAELRFKYRSDDLTDKELGPAALLPGYYNPEAYDAETDGYGLWEPAECYMIDEENNEVIVLTDHFSKYGLFEINGSGTRSAFTRTLDANKLAQISMDSAEKLIKAMNQNPNMSQRDLASLALGYLNISLNNNWILGADATNNLVGALTQTGGAVNTFSAALGEKIGMISVMGAMMKVASTSYTQGVFNYDNFCAVTEGGLTFAAYKTSESLPVVGLTILIVNIMKASGEYLVEQYNKNTDARFETLLNQYNRRRGNPDEEYWKQAIAPAYNRYLSEINPNNYEQCLRDYLNGVTNIVNNYVDQFYQEYQSGTLATTLGIDASRVPVVNTANLNLCNDVCDRYRVQLRKEIVPVLKYYCQLAYLSAIRAMQTELDAEAERLNGTVTLNFRESDGSGQARDCYALFTGADRKEWRVDFDDSGRASLTFTLLSYYERGTPRNIALFEKDTNLLVADIELPAALWDRENPAGTYDVPFTTGDFTKEITVREVRERDGDPCQFANCYAWLAPANGDRFRIQLDSEGCGIMMVQSEDYRDAGSPNRLEVYDPQKDQIVYSAPFDFSMRTVLLRDDAYRVSVTCADDKAVARYAGTTATLTAVEGSTVQEFVETEIDNTGAAMLMLPRPESNWMNGAYRFFISDGSSTPQELAQGIAKADTSQTLTFGSDGICSVVLTSDDEANEDEPYLELGETEVSLTAGQSRPLYIVQGEIGRVKSSNRGVASASRHNISAGSKAGTAILTFVDRNHPEHEVEVTVYVSEPSSQSYSGYYRRVTTYSHTETTGLTNSNETKAYPYGHEGTLIYIEVGYTRGGVGLAHIYNVREDGTVMSAQEMSPDPRYYYYRSPDGAGRMYWYNSLYELNPSATDGYNRNDWITWTGNSFYGEFTSEQHYTGLDVYQETHTYYWKVSDPRS